MYSFNLTCTVSVANKAMIGINPHETRSAGGYWNKEFVSYYYLVQLDQDTLTELEQGLELGVLLELPQSSSCTCQNLLHFLATSMRDDFPWPIIQLK